MIPANVFKHNLCLFMQHAQPVLNFLPLINIRNFKNISSIEFLPYVIFSFPLLILRFRYNASWPYFSSSSLTSYSDLFLAVEIVSPGPNVI
jgi:hypothetical protein